MRSRRITAIRRLANRSFRERVGQFLVEGPRAVIEAIRLRPEAIVEVLVAEDAAGKSALGARMAEAARLPVTIVSRRVLKSIADTVRPQGIVATCRFIDRPLTALMEPETRLAVILDAVRDPGNAGTVWRTADAVGADALVFGHGCADPYNGKVVRGTAGSLFHVPVVRDVAVADAVGVAREAGLIVIATDARAKRTLWRAEADGLLARPHAWVFGNEAHGLSDEAASSADYTVSVPIEGQAESLNLAVAAGVCLYASARVRDQARRAGSAT